MWFFPDWLYTLLNVFPFVYIYQLPLDLFIGKVCPADAAPRLCIQFVWVGILFGLLYTLQRRVTKKVMVQGG